MMTKIVVIEDEQPLLEEVCDMLRFEEFEVVGAANGREGIKLVREYLPDIVLCDIMMPEVDGYHVLLELRAETTTSTIPFIFLTAKAEKTDWRQGMNLGADDYLTKPFTHTELLAAIRSRLEKRQALAQLTAHELNSLREQILTVLPHELRTPLTNILGYSEILIEDGRNLGGDEVVHLAQAIYKSGLRLHRLIENYLIYIQIELVGENPTWIERLRTVASESPAPLIEAQVIEVAQRVKREADLELTLAESKPVGMMENYVKKVVEELVDNAFKFSKPGTRVQVIGAENTAGKYCVQISDSGRGMTAQQIAAVGAYTQFERKQYEQQGSGMGLIIAKRLMELHGGYLTIESTPHEGTRIEIVFP